MTLKSFCDILSYIRDLADMYFLSILIVHAGVCARGIIAPMGRKGTLALSCTKCS